VPAGRGDRAPVKALFTVLSTGSVGKRHGSFSAQLNMDKKASQALLTISSGDESSGSEQTSSRPCAWLDHGRGIAKAQAL